MTGPGNHSRPDEAEELERPAPLTRRAALVTGGVFLAVVAIVIWNSAIPSGEHPTRRSSHSRPNVVSPAVNAPQLLNVVVTTTPSFVSETANGRHNARYSVRVVNGHDYPITLRTGAITVPPAFGLLSGLPETATISARGSISLTLALHVRRCGTSDVEDRPIRLFARTDGEPWQPVVLQLPGAGPGGSWEAQVHRSACAGT